MTRHYSEKRRVAIIGAGPYGLSLGSYLHHYGADYLIIGKKMEFWGDYMPPDMFIRTLLPYSSFCDPDDNYTLSKFGEESGHDLTYPLPRSIFVEYGNWFIAQNDLRVLESYVADVSPCKSGGFILQLSDGTRIAADKVVVAVGVMYAKYIPNAFSTFPEQLVSHTADHISYGRFSNQRVAVLGGGQSAWEAAALLHRAEAAQVDLIFRRTSRIDGMRNSVNARQRELAERFYFMDEVSKSRIRQEMDAPSVSDFLVDMVEGHAVQYPNSEIGNIVIKQQDAGKRLHITVRDRNTLGDKEIEVDHLLLGTGYRYDLSKLDFISSQVRRLIATKQGYPVLDPQFQSSCHGVYFIGPGAINEFGPAYRVMGGIPYTCKRLVSDHGLVAASGAI